jgi:integrase
MRALDPRTEVPASARELLPPLGARRRAPYIYSAADVCALMRAAARLRGLKAATYATLLGLLAATGLRVGEALALDHTDLDLRAALLVVRRGKFGKARALALHPTTVTALRAYARTRDRAWPRPRGPAFFLSTHGTRLLYNNVHGAFLRLVAQAGLATRRPRRPRIHDLRHSFAVQTLVAWYRAGEDVEVRLPALSTYLGHVHPSCTYWYLTATPPLLRLAAQRLERVLGVRP